MDKPDRTSPGFRPAALDALNFLVSDVRGALGPFLNVYLVTSQHWTKSRVGVVTTVSGLLGLLVQTPAGALIDGTRAKRTLLAFACATLAAGAVLLYLFPSFWPVMIAQSAMSVVGDLFAPAVVAITLGLVRRRDLARRLGRNGAFDHAGNITIALVAAGIGYAFSQQAVFLIVPVTAALAIGATYAIPVRAIDHNRARGAVRGGDDDEEGSDVGGLSILWSCRPLLVFSLCAMLFHFANAPLLPMIGQRLAEAHRAEATPLMSACIVVAQGVMVPVALLVGHRADRWGRKPLLLTAFAVLPVRALLYTLSVAPAWVIGVQVLDGVAAGLFSAVTPLLVADLMRGTGRVNVAQGTVATMQGIGASLSGLASGELIDRAGYDVTFVALAAVAALALAALLFAMPETAPGKAKPERALAPATA